MVSSRENEPLVNILVVAELLHHALHFVEEPVHHSAIAAVVAVGGGVDIDVGVPVRLVAAAKHAIDASVLGSVVSVVIDAICRNKL